MPIVDPEMDDLMKTFERHVRETESCKPCEGLGVFLGQLGASLQSKKCSPCKGTGWVKRRDLN